MERIVDQHENSGADQIEGQMNGGHPFRVLADTDTGKNRRCTGPDVLPHNDRYRNSVCNAACHRESLKHADTCSRALDQSGNDHSCKHA